MSQRGCDSREMCVLRNRKLRRQLRRRRGNRVSYVAWKCDSSQRNPIRRRDARCDASGVSLVVATYSFGGEPSTLALPHEGGGKYCFSPGGESRMLSVHMICVRGEGAREWQALTPNPSPQRGEGRIGRSLSPDEGQARRKGPRVWVRKCHQPRTARRLFSALSRRPRRRRQAYCRAFADSCSGASIKTAAL
jgi:hypothetical protein